jgi:hypothetical protein
MDPPHVVNKIGADETAASRDKQWFVQMVVSLKMASAQNKKTITKTRDVLKAHWPQRAKTRKIDTEADVGCSM